MLCFVRNENGMGCSSRMQYTFDIVLQFHMLIATQRDAIFRCRVHGFGVTSLGHKFNKIGFSCTFNWSTILRKAQKRNIYIQEGVHHCDLHSKP